MTDLADIIFTISNWLEGIDLICCSRINKLWYDSCKSIIDRQTGEDWIRSLTKINQIEITGDVNKPFDLVYVRDRCEDLGYSAEYHECFIMPSFIRILDFGIDIHANNTISALCRNVSKILSKIDDLFEMNNAIVNVKESSVNCAASITSERKKIYQFVDNLLSVGGRVNEFMSSHGSLTIYFDKIKSTVLCHETANGFNVRISANSYTSAFKTYKKLRLAAK